VRFTLLLASFTGLLCAQSATPLRISQIQGSGSESPFAGQSVITSGVVTGVTADSISIQSLPADTDSDPLTSEGLWVYFAISPPGSVNRGYIVRVTGIVSEFRPPSDPGSPPLTELVQPKLEVLGQGQPLPAPVALTAGTDLERYEGMRVAVPELRTVSGTLGVVQEAAASAISNGVFYGVLPGQPRPWRAPESDRELSRLRVDTRGQGGQAVDVSTGATVRNLVGPLDFAFRSYSIAQDPSERVDVQGGSAPVGVPPRGPGEFTIAAANLQRFFDDRDDPSIADPILTPAALQTRMIKTSRAIRDVLQSPDILAVEEVENLDVLRALANASGEYDAQLFEGNDVGGIDVGLLTKRGRVQVLSVSQEGKAAMLGSGPLWDRPPLAARVSIDNVRFTVIVVHLQSLTDSGTAAVDAKRRAQAEALRDIIATRTAAGEQVVVAGDFNMTQFDPLMDVIRSGASITNLTDTLSPSQNYSYVRDGVTETLDHVLISDGMRSRIVRYQFARINADFPESVRGDSGMIERVSDHDFPVAYFSVAPESVQLVPAGVTNGASFLGGPVAPLEVITIFGRNLGPSVLAFAGNVDLPTSLAGTRVLFDGVPTGLIYTSATQVSAVAPQFVAGKNATTMQVEYAGQMTNPVVLSVAPAAPGISSLAQNGRGQGAILNQDSSVNGASNPAEPGSIIQIFGTGGGLLAPTVGDVPARLVQNVNVLIGGVPAEVIYAGEAPGLISGAMQINARLPVTTPGGNVSVVITVGNGASALGMTLTVQPRAQPAVSR